MVSLAVYLAGRVVNVGVLGSSQIEARQHGCSICNLQPNDRHRLDRRALCDGPLGILKGGAFGKKTVLELIVVNKERFALEVVLQHRVAAKPGARPVQLSQRADWCWPRRDHVERDPCSEPREPERVLVTVEQLHVKVRVEMNRKVDRRPCHRLLEHQLPTLLLPPRRLCVASYQLENRVLP